MPQIFTNMIGIRDLGCELAVRGTEQLLQGSPGSAAVMNLSANQTRTIAERAQANKIPAVFSPLSLTATMPARHLATQRLGRVHVDLERAKVPVVDAR